MVAMIGELFLPLMFVGLISPIAAVIAAILLFGRHRARVEPERRVPVINNRLRRHRRLLRFDFRARAGLSGYGQPLWFVPSIRHRADLLRPRSFAGRDCGLLDSARAETRR
jgi:hypothetical protein